jgi:hypothetical protein
MFRLKNGGFFFKSTKLVGTEIRDSLEKQELNNKWFV